MLSKDGFKYEVVNTTAGEKNEVEIKFEKTGSEKIVDEKKAMAGEVTDKTYDELVGNTYQSEDGEYEVIRIHHRDKHYNKFYLVRFFGPETDVVARRPQVKRGAVKRKESVIGREFTTNKGEDFIVVRKVGAGRYLCYFPDIPEITAVDKYKIRTGSVNPNRFYFREDGEIKSFEMTVKGDDWIIDEPVEENFKAIKVWNSVRYFRKPKGVCPQIKRLSTFKELIPYDLESMKYIDVPVVMPDRTTLELRPKDLNFSLTK